jgi:hypothetical protein
MTPQYRDMILDDQMAPLSELSSAFLAPKSSLHLQFAYFESALAVAFLVDNYGGIDTIKKLLDDLAEGSLMNETLIRHVAPLGRLDAAFAKHVRKLAEELGPGLTWDECDLPPVAQGSPRQFLRAHPVGPIVSPRESVERSTRAGREAAEAFPRIRGTGQRLCSAGAGAP